MARGTPGAYLIPWSQTLVDGMSGAPVARLEVGAPWVWNGEAIPLRLTSDTDCSYRLREAALRAVRQILGDGTRATLTDPGLSLENERTFAVTDGRRRYVATLIDVVEIARPLILFVDGLPPAGRKLRIVDTGGSGSSINRLTEEPTGVICFTQGTQLLTPDGPRLVEDLVEGDKVLTKDDGPQDILWIGSRRMSGARLYAMPELRPVRIRSGAINGDCPEPDLIVSPRHRIVLKGDIARALFGTPEVLIKAEDLMDDRGILIDRSLTEVTYVHILLPRHQVVWANGVETESFHPASTDLQTITEDQRARLLSQLPGIEHDPHTYGEAARKPLSAEEASIFGGEAGPKH